MSLKNWDNKTWLSSSNYIKFFNNFLLRQVELNKNSKILDIGCGRGKILGNLASKLKLIKKPIGIDIERHKDRDKRIVFNKVDATNYLKKNKNKFYLILIKQTIHLIGLNKIKKFLYLLKKNLNSNGRAIILILDDKKNEIPTFKLMKYKLKRSLEKDNKIIKFINKNYPYAIKKEFTYQVRINKKKYLKMIKNRYISTLLSFSENQILKGIKEINLKYGEFIFFKDKLICIIL